MNFQFVNDFMAEYFFILLYGLIFGVGLMFGFSFAIATMDVWRQLRGDMRKIDPNEFFGDLFEIELCNGTVMENLSFVKMPRLVRFTTSIGFKGDFFPLISENGVHHVIPESKIVRITRVRK